MSTTTDKTVLQNFSNVVKLPLPEKERMDEWVMNHSLGTY